jgi:hypothetical protein
VATTVGVESEVLGIASIGAKGPTITVLYYDRNSLVAVARLRLTALDEKNWRATIQWHQGERGRRCRFRGIGPLHLGGEPATE